MRIIADGSLLRKRRELAAVIASASDNRAAAEDTLAIVEDDRLARRDGALRLFEAHFAAAPSRRVASRGRRGCGSGCAPRPASHRPGVRRSTNVSSSATRPVAISSSCGPTTTRFVVGVDIDRRRAARRCRGPGRRVAGRRCSSRCPSCSPTSRPGGVDDSAGGNGHAVADEGAVVAAGDEADVGGVRLVGVRAGATRGPGGGSRPWGTRRPGRVCARAPTVRVCRARRTGPSPGRRPVAAARRASAVRVRTRA